VTSAEMVGPASLAISQGVTAFLSFLPKLSDIRKADPATDPGMVGDVRMGEVAATAVCVGVGAIVSSLTGSPVPAFTAVVVALTLICIYESALASDRAWEPKRTVRSEDA
jgi:hypothetical protein